MQTQTEYHLIDLYAGISHGGFASLAAAREHARAEDMPAWDIWRGNRRVEYHDPLRPCPGRMDEPRLEAPRAIKVKPADSADCRALGWATAARAERARDPRLRDRLSELASTYFNLACTLERSNTLIDELDEMREASLSAVPAMGTA